MMDSGSFKTKFSYTAQSDYMATAYFPTLPVFTVVYLKIMFATVFLPTVKA